jgi:hypothetical protein
LLACLKNKEQRTRIVGKIFLIDSKKATLDENPYNLAIDTEYFVCYAELYKVPAKRAAKGVVSIAGAKSGSSEKGNAGTSSSTADNDGAAAACMGEEETTTSS